MDSSRLDFSRDDDAPLDTPPFTGDQLRVAGLPALPARAGWPAAQGRRFAQPPLKKAPRQPSHACTPEAYCCLGTSFVLPPLTAAEAAAAEDHANPPPQPARAPAASRPGQAPPAGIGGAQRPKKGYDDSKADGGDSEDHAVAAAGSTKYRKGVDRREKARSAQREGDGEEFLLAQRPLAGMRAERADALRKHLEAYAARGGERHACCRYADKTCVMQLPGAAGDQLVVVLPICAVTVQLPRWHCEMCEKEWVEGPAVFGCYSAHAVSRPGRPQLVFDTEVLETVHENTIGGLSFQRALLPIPLYRGRSHISSPARADAAKSLRTATGAKFSDCLLRDAFFSYKRATLLKLRAENFVPGLPNDPFDMCPGCCADTRCRDGEKVPLEACVCDWRQV